MKTHQLWNVHFLNQIIDTMAEGLFTLDDQGQIMGIAETITDLTALSAVKKTADDA